MPLLRSRTLTLFATIVLALCVPAQAQIKEVEAYAGRPFGVGRITLEARPAADGLDSLTAAGFRLVDADDRTFYPAVEVAKVGEFLRNFLKLRGPQKVNVYFLFQGDAPLRVKCYTPSPMTAEIRPRISAEGHRELLEDWWEEYTGNLRDLGSGGEYPVVVHNYVASMLANRLGLDPREIGNYGERNPLEQTIGLMLGTESIRAAMARDVLLSDAEDPSPVSEPLPEPVAPPPVEYPAVDPEVEVESIASHVPQECFYVRFGDFRNYLWLRDLMSRWGGDLENMISRRGIDYRVTSKIERQLSLKESKLARVLGPAVISDVAIIGTDTFFHEGPAMGILFEARNSFALGSDISGQRTATLDSVENATEEKIEIEGKDISFISTPDNSVRSFYVAEGSYHLVTNSRTIARRFIEIANGEGALGDSLEFRHARSVMPVERGDDVFIYLSDEFFRQLVGPRYRVELTRRMRATTEMQMIDMAWLASNSEGMPAETAEDLIAGGFLPRYFGQRPDRSEMVAVDGKLVDSLRGARGTFLPIPDAPVEEVTPAEAAAYQRFADYYRSQWEQMDPVMIGIHRHQEPGKIERLAVDVHVDPLARLHYSILQDFVGPATRTKVATVEGDVISAQGMVSSRIPILNRQIAQQPYVHMFGGLQDGTWPLNIRSGRIAPPDLLTQLIPAYAATTPPTALIEAFIPRRLPPLDAEGYGPLLGGLAWRRIAGGFSAISFSREVLRQVTPQFRLVEAERPAQIRMRVADLTQADFGKMVTAFSYVRARDTSQAGADLMNALHQQLRVPLAGCREVAEDLLNARLACALGGDYEVVDYPGGLQSWSSNAVGRENRFALINVPPDYRFPFLEWFRGAKVEVTMVEDNLQAHAELWMNQAEPGERLEVLPTPPPVEEIPPPGE